MNKEDPSKARKQNRRRETTKYAICVCICQYQLSSADRGIVLREGADVYHIPIRLYISELAVSCNRLEPMIDKLIGWEERYEFGMR